MAKIMLYNVCYGHEAIAKAAITNPFKEAYCHKHGYQWYFECHKDMPQRHPYWQKSIIGMDLLPKCDILMWLDADAAPVEFSKKVEDFINPQFSFSVCRDVISFNKKEWYFNAGVFIIRNNDFGQALLKEWAIGDAESEKSPLKDQTRINNMYDKNWNNMHEHTQIWDKGTMQSTNNGSYKQGCWIKHCAATSAKNMAKTFYENLPNHALKDLGENHPLIK